jgi:hypothetical protein
MSLEKNITACTWIAGYRRPMDVGTYQSKYELVKKISRYRINIEHPV